MKSGLGDRNNLTDEREGFPAPTPRLNEVRSWRPEQCLTEEAAKDSDYDVSMKSGLGDRNNLDKLFEALPTHLEVSQ